MVSIKNKPLEKKIRLFYLHFSSGAESQGGTEQKTTNEKKIHPNFWTSTWTEQRTQNNRVGGDFRGHLVQTPAQGWSLIPFQRNCCPAFSEKPPMMEHPQSPEKKPLHSLIILTVWKLLRTINHSEDPPKLFKFGQIFQALTQQGTGISKEGYLWPLASHSWHHHPKYPPFNISWAASKNNTKTPQTI